MAAAANDTSSEKTRGSRFGTLKVRAEPSPSTKLSRSHVYCTTEDREATDCLGWGSHKKHEQECIRRFGSCGIGLCRGRGLLGARQGYGAQIRPSFRSDRCCVSRELRSRNFSRICCKGGKCFGSPYCRCGRSIALR